MSESSGSSFNTSSSGPVETNENAILDQIAQYSEGLAGQIYNWAQNTYAQTSQVTNQVVSSFLQTAQQMSGFGQNIMNQYNSLFAPENAQLVQDANTYASPSRMAVDMGAAGATASQAGQAAMNNANQALQSYGIDPSSGRYAALDKAMAVQNAAAIAGAENQQRNTDIATGQQLRAEAVQAGETLPAAAVNAANTAVQAGSAASNAALANANTGANMFSVPNQYLSTAMALKLPATASSSHGSSQNQSSGSKNGSGGGSGGGGNSNPFGPSSPNTWSGMTPDTAAQGTDAGGGGRGYPSAGITRLSQPTSGGGSDQPPPEGGQDWTSQGQPPIGEEEWGQMFGQNPQWNPQEGTGGSEFGGIGEGTIGQPTEPSVDYGGSNPFSTDEFGQTLPQEDFGGETAGFGGQSGTGSMWDPTANQPQLPEGWNDPTSPQDTNWGSPPSSGGDTSGSGDTSGDTSSGDDSGDFAAGGAIPENPRAMQRPAQRPMQTSGGMIPRSASPSNGRVQDDVNAHVNADEFVIPKDVARWKGEEYFHKLIAQSRALRAKSPVGGKPSARPTPPGARPTFVSHPMQ